MGAGTERDGVLIADPTPTDIDNAITVVDADLPTAVEELKRLTRVLLPAAVTRWNTRRGWTVWTPLQFRWAPADLTESDIHCVLFDIADAVQTTMGQGRFRTDATILAHFIGPKLGPNSDEQLRNAWRMAAMFKGIIRNVQDGQIDGNGFTCWGQCVPQNTRFLPSQWRSYSGATVPLQVIVWPGANSWAAA